MSLAGPSGGGSGGGGNGAGRPAAVVPIRVVLPTQHRTLAGIGREVTLDIELGEHEDACVAITQRRVLDALEAAYPALSGTMRDRATGRRRPFIRFFACEEDISHDPPDAPLPERVVRGSEPFIVLGAIAGG